MAVHDEIEALIIRRSGLTEMEIAEALFGNAAYQQRANSPCRRLIREGRVKRSGKGGQADPYTYTIV